VEARDEDGTLEIDCDYVAAFGTKGSWRTTKRDKMAMLGPIWRSGYKNAIFEPVKPFIMKAHFGGFGWL
jgi:hypothetical protein